MEFMKNSAYRDKKKKYLDRAKVGTIVAFECADGTTKSAKILSKNDEHHIVLETAYGTRYVIEQRQILWVKTGPRWPRGIYNQLKGNESDGIHGKRED
jgi:5,10-methenyltetrahydromethanopterin hydrogenase